MNARKPTGLAENRKATPLLLVTVLGVGAVGATGSREGKGTLEVLPQRGQRINAVVLADDVIVARELRRHLYIEVLSSSRTDRATDEAAAHQRFAEALHIRVVLRGLEQVRARGDPGRRVRVRDGCVGVLRALPFERARRRRRQRARAPLRVVADDLAEDLAYLIAYKVPKKRLWRGMG